MILVLLGTQNNSFHRLLDALEECIENQIIQDQVIVQCGYTRFTSKYMELIDFIPVDEFDTLINEADLIITHGGVGSIINSIKARKKVIAVPRLNKYNEHVNNHQVQIIKTFDEKGFIKGVFDISQLANTLLTIDNFTPAPYVSNNEKILGIISNYIDNN